MSIDKTLFNRLGGRETLLKVHKIFYDKAYADPWLRPYFTDKPQQTLEDQQTDFMAQIMGGPKAYAGKTPKMAHQHMFITEELFAHRQQLLAESISQANIQGELKEDWLQVDSNLKLALVKKTPGECKGAYKAQEILNFPNPKK